MPLGWKFVNAIFILLPKTILWGMTAAAGVMMLMETAGISDTLVNSMALSFILAFDVVVCNSYTLFSIKLIMEKIEDYYLYNTDEDEQHSDHEVLRIYEQDHLHSWSVDLNMLLPWRLTLMLGLTAMFVLQYYLTRCVLSGESFYWISKTLYAPASADEDALSFGLPWLFPLATESTAYWTAPVAGENSSGPLVI